MNQFVQSYLNIAESLISLKQFLESISYTSEELLELQYLIPRGAIQFDYDWQQMRGYFKHMNVHFNYRELPSLEPFIPGDKFLQSHTITLVCNKQLTQQIQSIAAQRQFKIYYNEG